MRHAFAFLRDEVVWLLRSEAVCMPQAFAWRSHLRGEAVC
jgi:hypothetical protein